MTLSPPRLSQILIAPMRKRHLPAVLRIEHRAHPKPWTLGVFTSELAQSDSRYYVVCRAGGKIAGYAGLMFIADEAHVTNLAVAPHMRRQRLGTRLLMNLAQESTRRHCSAMTLEVRISNVGAQQLYHKFGFVSAGVRRNYYSETGEDALIMWLYELLSESVQERLRTLGEAA
jgi:ribosomal-protein-alanine N-acetyltransferase